MRVLVNALSVTNLSGQHVLLGHLTQLAAGTRGRHEYVVLYHSGNSGICRELGENVTWRECLSLTSQWAGRTAWENLYLPRLLGRLKVDLIYMPSGITVRSSDVPQVSFAPNPWALVADMERTAAEKVKALFQRKAYRSAMKKAEIMIFLSEFMRRAYRENAGFREKDSGIAYAGIDEATFDSARKARGKFRRRENSVLCVSAMARHKGIETLVKAVALLKRSRGIQAHLSLVGPWPDSRYENDIRICTGECGIESQVSIAGHVPMERLHQYYAESKVFCLMSTCESFGIPAVEAQVFGTPVVSSNCCAIPEVCGRGGIYPEAGDVEGTAEALAGLLSDRSKWEELSHEAAGNAGRFKWEVCSRPLFRMFEVVK